MPENHCVLGVEGFFSRDTSTWELELQILGDTVKVAPISSAAFFEDASQAFYEEMRWYIEKHATENPFEKERASKTLKRIHEFRDRLYETITSTLTVQELIVAGVKRIDLEVRGGKGFDLGDTDCFRIPWELLEGVSRQDSVQITVRRSVSPKDDVSVNSTDFQQLEKPSLNILLVVARDFTKRHEIDHQVITKPLYDTLKGLPSRDHFQIQTLRPPSFESLQRHLESSSVKYDVVHFDMHGVVREDGGMQRPGLVFQADQDLGQMNLVDGARIAQLLCTHNVKAVVLNACESARADANLAKELVRNGIDIAVASAFKLHMDVAMIFMRHFYQGLFDGLDIDELSRQSRAKVRSHPIRRARFHTTVELEDWFTPVLYHKRGLDLKKVMSPLFVDDAGASPSSVMAPGLWRFPETQIPECKGRQADILQLECIFVEAGCQVIVLTGFHGIGKTLLIDHLNCWWVMTGLFDEFLLLDATLIYDFTLVNRCIAEKIFPGETHLWKDDKALLERIQSSGMRLILSVDDYDRCEEQFKEQLQKLVSTVSGMPGNLCLLSASDISEVGEELEAFEFHLEGLWKEAALELAFDVAEKSQVPRPISQWKNPELLETLLGLVDFIPLAIVLIVETLGSVDALKQQRGIQAPPMTPETACMEMIAGEFQIIRTAESCYKGDRLKFQDFLQEYLMDATVDGLQKELFFQLAPFVSSVPVDIEPLSLVGFNFIGKHAGRPPQEAAELMERFHRGESITINGPTPDAWYLGRCKEAYDELIKRLKKECLLIDTGEAYLIHPLLTRIMRRVLHDPGFDDTASRLALFSGYFGQYYEGLLQKQWASDSAQEIIDFVTTNFRNLVASQLVPLYVPNLDANTKAMVFFQLLSKDVVFSLSKRIVFHGHNEDRPLVKILWKAISEQYQTFTQQLRAQNQSAEIPQKATEIASYAVLGEVDDLCRRTEWRAVGHAVERAERILRDITDADEALDAKLKLRINQAQAFFGLRDSLDALKQSIKMHEVVEVEAQEFLAKMTPEMLEKDRSRLEKFVEIARSRAVNKGFLHSLHVLLRTAEKTAEVSTTCESLRMQVAEDWNYAVKLAGIVGELPAMDMKKIADWLIKAHNAPDDLTYAKMQLSAPTDRESVEDKHKLNQAAYQALTEGRHEDFASLLLDKLEIAEAETPVNYLAMAEIHQQLSILAANQENPKDAVDHARRALSAIEKVSPETLPHYNERRAYIGLEIAINAYICRDIPLALQEAEKAIASCSPFASSSYAIRTILLSLYSFNSMLSKDDSTTAFACYTAMKNHMRHSHLEEFVRKGELLGRGESSTAENFNLRLSDLLPLFFTRFEEDTIKLNEANRGKELRYLLEAYIASPPSQPHMVTLFELPTRINSEIDTAEFLRVFSSWYGRNIDVLPEEVLKLACNLAESAFCTPGIGMEKVLKVTAFGAQEEKPDSSLGKLGKLFKGKLSF